MVEDFELPSGVTVLFCDRLAKYVGHEERASLIGIFNRIFSNIFPFRREVAVAVVHQVMPPKGDYRLHVVHEQTGDIANHPTAQTKPNNLLLWHWASFEFKQEGNYIFNIVCDGKAYAKRTLSIFRQQ